MSFYQFDIVTITHGLGNQMSQYAFYLAKKQTRKNTWAINLCDTGEHYGYELGRIFNVKIEGFLNRFFIISIELGTDVHFFISWLHH